MTLKEIAQMADVSITTVSRVLNTNDTKVASEEVRKKIIQIASENGYSSTRASKATREKSRACDENQFEFLYCMCARPYSESCDDTFYDELIDGIQDAAYKSHCILRHRFELRDLENGLLEMVMEGESHRNLITMGRIDRFVLDRLSHYFTNIMCISLNRMELTNHNYFDQIYCDGFLAGVNAVDYLWELGHRSIGFIGQRGDSRLDGYLEGLRKHNLPADEALMVGDAILNMEGGHLAMQRLLSRPKRPTAVFCTSDRIAIGALSVCHNSGIRVPDDISVIGMNDIEPAKFVTPSLTTIHVPLREMGALAVRTLSERIYSGRSIPIQIGVPFYIEKRNSCGKCND